MYHTRNYCLSLLHFLRLKKKENFEELRVKKTARISKTDERDIALVASFCKLCGASRHTSKRSHNCPNHDLILLQLLSRDLGAH